MKRESIYLSTIAADADHCARQQGLGLEIAEFCTAINMDEKLADTSAELTTKLDGISRKILHAPFNELFPCAIDTKARELARERYRQAIALAQEYEASKVVIHGGYNPRIYYPVWYVEQSIVFWEDFVKEIPQGLELCLENVLEEEPSMLFDIVSAVNDPQLKLCLDVGHVNAYSQFSCMDWLKHWSPWLSHFHIHNNDRSWDSHSPLYEGTIPMKEFLLKAAELCPSASFTLEVTEAEPSVRWLLEELPWNND